MKRIFTLLLCIALVISMLALVSCKKNKDDEDDKFSDTLNGKTPEELYEYSQTQLKEADSYYIKATQKITMTYEGETIVMNQVVESKVNGDNTYMKSENDMTSGANIEAWYVDGISYANAFGQKVKMKISKEEYMEEYMNADPTESTLLDIPKSWFEDIKFEKVGDSNVLKFVVSEEKYNELLGNVGFDSASIVGDVDYKIYFDDDGNIEKVVTIFDMLIEGITAHAESVSHVTIADVKVNPPADADRYTEVSPN